MRLIIVIREADAATANAAIAEATGNDADAETFTRQLARSSAPTTPVARWCSWDFAATGRNRLAVARKIADVLNIPLADLAERPTASGSLATKRIAVFDASRVNPAQILAHFDLVHVRPPPGQG